jgi:hypothetical protein
MTEPIRAYLAIIQGVLGPLDAETRAAVLAELDLETAKDVQKLSKMLDESRETTEEWRKFNEQRLEEVTESRKILGATPNETFAMALKRNIDGWFIRVRRLEIQLEDLRRGITPEPVKEGWTGR